jgi:crotonobetaine/carnitine-CoA ligase
VQLNAHEVDAATLRDMIRARAALGDKPLAIVADDVLTYAQADERGNRLANALGDLGVAKGDVVATYMQNSIEHICMWFACAKLGAIWAPLNIALINLDLIATIEDAAPKVLAIDRELVPNLLAVRDQLEHPALTVVHGDGADGALEPGWVDFASLLAAPAEEPEVEIAPSDPAGLIYTGGSTGRPKGVLVANLWYVGGVLRYGEMLEPKPDDVHIGVGQLCHTIGSAVDVLGPVYHGLTTVLGRRFSASRFWDVARRHGGTLTVLVGPVMMALLGQEPRAEDAENPIRLVATAAGQMPQDIYDGFAERFGTDLLELYGQTETGPLGCISQRLHDRPYRSLGTANGWAEISVAGPDDSPCPAGVVGEILLRPTHAHTFLLGYHRQPERFAEACRNLWFHTGDLGHLDEQGYLHFDGRVAHAIRRRGENIAAGEVEAVLVLHPAVAECAVVGVPAELGEEEIKAYVVPHNDVSIDPLDMVRFCEERIAYFKVPRYVELVGELPRSVTKNEIERYKLRARGIGDAWDREAAAYEARRPT